MMQKAVIYTRVSTGKQATDGHGLDSQEINCRQYAKNRGYTVIEVFRDDGISGKFYERPAMQDLKNFLDANSGEKFVVIFDDLKRFARDVTTHLKLKVELVDRRGARLESPNFDFDNSPHGEFIEIVLAAGAEMERKQNVVQVKSRMQAQAASGRWIWYAPPGYKNARDEIGRKIVIKSEPEASIIKTMLEGFANGNLLTVEACRAFLEQHNFDHWGKKRNRAYHEQAKRILEREFYAGWVVNEKWKLRVRGRHEPLISDETFQRIQYRLAGHGYKERVDRKSDFVLRGFVVSEDLDTKFTGSCSSGRAGRKYPYYHALHPDKRHIRVTKEKFEDQFCEHLKKAGDVNPEIVRLFYTIISQQHTESQKNDVAARSRTEKRAEEVDQEIRLSVVAAAKTNNESVRQAYEARIAELSSEKDRLQVELATPGKLAPKDLGNIFAKGVAMLKNPAETWKNGNLQERTAVQKLAFRLPLRYSVENKFGNSEFSLIYRVLSDSAPSESQLVEMPGIEPGSRKSCAAVYKSYCTFEISNFRIKSERKALRFKAQDFICQVGNVAD